MSRRGQEIGAGEALVLVCVAALVPATAAFAIGPTPGLAGWLTLAVVLQFVAGPVGTLVHELGHALAVVVLTRRPALVIVGRGPWLGARMGGVVVRASPVPTRGVSFGGLCRFDPVGLPWRARGWIALAGPLATAGWIVALVAVTPLLWADGTWVRYLLILMIASQAGSLLVNLFTRQVPSTVAIVAPRDGEQARRFFALHRAGAPVPAGTPIRLPVHRSVAPPTGRNVATASRGGETSTTARRRSR